MRCGVKAFLCSKMSVKAKASGGGKFPASTSHIGMMIEIVGVL